MMAVDKAFIDTNVLVYAHMPLSPFHVAATALLHRYALAGAELWISRQILREFLATMTRPGPLTASIPRASVLSDLCTLQTQFLVAEDGTAVTARLGTILHGNTVGGRQVHDANIVAIMLAYGVPMLLTHNVKDFIPFAHLVTVVPLVP